MSLATTLAQRLGIAVVRQNPQLIDSMDVLHNVFLGREISGPSWFKWLPEERQMLAITRELLITFEMSPDLF